MPESGESRESGVIRGSCHCQQVKFEITGPIRGFMHCHCRTCRKLHGTAYGSSALVAATHFRLTSGASSFAIYESSPGKKRHFCPACHAQIYARYDDAPEDIVLRMGLLDDDPGIRPSGHIWTTDQAPWVEIHDDLPQHPKEPADR